MAYSPFVYGTTYHAYSQEETFQDYPSQRLDEPQFEMALNNIDPTLHVVSPTIPFAPSWNPPMMQRFQKDPQKLALFNPVPPMHAMAHHNNIGRPVPPVPPPSQGRHGSPVSSHEPSSSCSSAQSPPGSEFYTDYGPSTPPDMAVFSPFQTSRGDHWEPPSQYGQLLGMRAFPAETCVSMQQINPSQDLYHEFEPQSPMNLSLQRSSTYGSQASSAFETDTASVPTSLDFPIKRVASPVEMHPPVKDEIHIVHPVPSNKGSKSEYPPLGSDDDEDLEDEHSAIIPKAEDDDDDDYDPANRRNKRTNSANTRRGQKTKRPSPRSIEKAAPKRQKTGSASSPPPKILPPSPPGSKGSLFCRECSLNFKDQTGYDGHVKKQHTRPFVCVFNFAGCDSTFASKNEWKRHVSSQHLLLHYWLCIQDTCVHTKNGPPSPSVAPQTTSNKRSRGRGHEESINVAPQLPNGAIFNRKDLYTQHLRRMHTPPHIKKAAKSGKKSSGSGAHPDWDDHIRGLQQTAVQERCQLPTQMACPAPGCKQTFTGADAWDQRMEHVARHLEKAAAGREPSVVFGGPADGTLMQWCTSPSVGVVKRAANGKWELNNPLKAEGGKDLRQTATSNSDPLVKNEIVVESGGEEDAEGEYE